MILSDNEEGGNLLPTSFPIRGTLILITLILILIIVIAQILNKKNLLSIDRLFALVGVLLGLFITGLNLLYSNKYLITLGPLITAASFFYIVFQDKLLKENTSTGIHISARHQKIINILYWICTLAIIIMIYWQQGLYIRPLFFFIIVSIDVSTIGLQITFSKYKNNFEISKIIFKILLLSLLLKASAFFISPYPIGIDPWSHEQHIQDIIHYSQIQFRPGADPYYLSYPLMHVFAASFNIVGNLSTKESMFMIGFTLTLSTIFVFLISKKITKRPDIALLSMLLINFAEFNIQWSVQIIAMSYAISIYTILLYTLLGKQKNPLIFKCFSLMYLVIIVWAHTASSFILILSTIAIYSSDIIYRHIYLIDQKEKHILSYTFVIASIVLTFFHWINPYYSFFDLIMNGLNYSVSNELGFLNREPITDHASENIQILDIVGFLIYNLFGIIGTLCILSRKYINNENFALFFVFTGLFFMFFVFPLFGISNNEPYRWPAFIYVSYLIFASVGFTKIISLSSSNSQKAILVFFILFVSSFFMITNSHANIDSPKYRGEIDYKYFIKESELELVKNIDELLEGYLTSDAYMSERISQITERDVRYIPTKVHPMSSNQETIMDPDQCLDYIRNNKIAVLCRLDVERKYDLRKTYGFDQLLNCIYDVGTAKIYM